MATYPELKGRSVLVTGAGRGIGLAIAHRFVREGSRVLMTDIEDGDSQSVISLADESSSQAAYYRLDVTSRAEVDAGIAKVVELFGRLDVMVCNAGVGEIAPLIEASEGSFDRQMKVNASGAGKIAPGKATPLGIYAMTKHAAVGLTKQLGAELAGDGILVNCVCGGIVDTAMWELIDREVTRRSGEPQGSYKAAAAASVPIGRIQTPDDMASMFVYLASDDAGYSAGQTFNCSGGLLPY